MADDQKFLPADPSPVPETADEKRAISIGMAMAATIIMRSWGDDTAASEILIAAGLDTLASLQAIGLDDYDMQALTPVVEFLADRAASEGRNDANS